MFHVCVAVVPASQKIFYEKKRKTVALHQPGNQQQLKLGAVKIPIVFLFQFLLRDKQPLWFSLKMSSFLLHVLLCCKLGLRCVECAIHHERDVREE